MYSVQGLFQMRVDRAVDRIASRTKSLWKRTTPSGLTWQPPAVKISIVSATWFRTNAGIPQEFQCSIDNLLDTIFGKQLIGRQHPFYQADVLLLTNLTCASFSSHSSPANDSALPDKESLD